MANDLAYGIQYWPVFDRETNQFAGCCGLKPGDPEQRHYEIGFQFLPPFQGRGLASEAARAAVAYAFDTLDAAALFAGRHPENATSARLLERLGFEQIGTHFFARTGLEHPWYRRLRE